LLRLYCREFNNNPPGVRLLLKMGAVQSVSGWTEVLPCSLCELPLYLPLHQAPIHFRCENGHLFTVQDLLRRWFPDHRPPSPLALRTWAKWVRLFGELARGALSFGNVLMAADLQEVILSVADRLQTVSSPRAPGSCDLPERRKPWKIHWSD